MRKIIVHMFLTLDGVMQAPGGPEEDASGVFKYGGWLLLLVKAFVWSSRLRRPSARNASAGSRSPSLPSPMAVSSQHGGMKRGIVLVQTARL
jgi:hypothetical protein